jgi:small subunit ribosomal protein S17
MAKSTNNSVEATKGGRSFSGTVVSTKMKDTIVVAVTRYVKHPKYQKFLKRVKKYHAHDAGNTKEVGDRVEIRETRPLSKTKHFIVANEDK